MSNTPSAMSALPAFGATIVQTPERAVVLEWLETNGLGDYACGTVAGPNTRRQHGLFTAGSTFGGQRMLLLAGLDVVLEREEESFALSCHQYINARRPEGYRLCSHFLAYPFPEWQFTVPGATLTNRVFMPHGKRAVICAWLFDAESPSVQWRLRIRPLFAYREANALTHANDAANMTLRPNGDGFAFSPYPHCPELFLRHNGAKVRQTTDWYYRFFHPWDVALGQEAEEDLFSPCEMVFELAPGKQAVISAGVEPLQENLEDLESHERTRRFSISVPGLENDPIARTLASAAKSLISTGIEGQVVISSGYPTPVDDLRMALISLPGVLLCTRSLEAAKRFLTHTLRRFETAQSALLTDVPLWLLRAGEQYVDFSRDWDFLRDSLAPAGEVLLQRYMENKSDDGFRLAPDGLLVSPPGTIPLTWMNARMDEMPVTPRAGKPVEVNALWHHALSLMSRWARRREQTSKAERYDTLRELCGRSFRHRFWNDKDGCLFDVVDTPEGPSDPAVRPNQIFALSLPSDLLERRQAESVFSLVEKRLVTPYGLHTLSLDDPSFRPRYGGWLLERAAAQHQGAIFPWLIGHYVDAMLRVRGRTPRALTRAAACLDTLLHEHLSNGCVGQISELFNGTLPHAAHGAFAHAAAAGELLRAYTEAKGRLV